LVDLFEYMMMHGLTNPKASRWYSADQHRPFAARITPTTYIHTLCENGTASGCHRRQQHNTYISLWSCQSI